MTSAICDNCNNRHVSYFDTSLQFKISQCGHQFCSTCIGRIFASAPAVPCPKCDKLIHRTGLSSKTKSQLEFERLVRARAKIIALYNKTEADFYSIRDFNDYLEQRASIIHNLAFRVDEATTQAEVAAYAREHRAEIDLHASKKAQLEREASAREKKAAEEKTRLQREMLVSHQLQRRQRRARRRQNLDLALGSRGVGGVSGVGGAKDAAAAADSRKAAAAAAAALRATVAQQQRQAAGLLGGLLGAAPVGASAGSQGLLGGLLADGALLAAAGAQPTPVSGFAGVGSSAGSGGRRGLKRGRRRRQQQKEAGGWQEEDVRKRAWEEVKANIFMAL